jgi:hypothetical protein
MLQQQSRFGFYRFFEISEQFGITFVDTAQPDKELKLRIAACNVPLRKYGPSKATALEYAYGKQLRGGQAYMSVAYGFPFLRSKSQYRFKSILEHFSTSGLNYEQVLDPFSTAIAGGMRMPSLFASSMLDRSDLSVLCRLGLADWCMLTELFETKTTYYVSPPDSANSGYSILDGQNHAEKNNVFSNLLALTFSPGNNSRATLAFHYAWQKDTYGGAARDWEIRNAMVIFMYQGTIHGRTADYSMSEGH